MLLLATVIFLSLPKGDGAKDIDEVCSAGLQKCLYVYINDVSQHTTDREICQDVSMFVGCILELDCDLSTEVKMQSFQTVELGLAQKGLKCDKISEMKVTYLNGLADSNTQPASKSRPDSRASMSKSRSRSTLPPLPTTPPNTASSSRQMDAACFVLQTLVIVFILFKSAAHSMSQ